MALAHTKTPSIGFATGLGAVYAGERVMLPGLAASTVTIAGLAVIVLALVLAIRQGKGRPAGWILPSLYGLGLLALLLHFVRTTLPGLLGHRALEISMPKVDGALAALWPALLCASMLPVLLVELSYAGMTRAPVVDSGRLRRAMRSGLGVSFALVFCFAISYVAAERNRKADLSFFRTARASAATKQLVAALDQPLEVTLFYPPGNEVAEELAGYFGDLKRAGSKVTVVRADQAVEPAKGKALGVSANGAVALARGTQHEQIQIPIKLESARAKLRSLDQDVYKRILMLSRGKRTIYLVQGHGERAFTTPRDGDANASLSRLKELLGTQNLETRELSIAQGLGNEVPADAALVMVIGPQQAMLAEETAALLRYFQGGGRMLLAVDPDAAKAAAPLLGGLAIELSPVSLANDRMFWARTRQKSDRIGIAAASYSSHASLPTMSQFGAQLPVVFLGAGNLSKTKVVPTPAPNVDFVVRTDGSTWEDKDGNFEYDKDEQRKVYNLGAAVTLRPPAPAGGKPAAKGEPEARAFVLGDSDPFSDLIIANRANAIFAVDVLRWLLGEPEVAGPPTSEEDVPVRHTRKQDAVWFYASVFLVPGLVLLVGFIATRRRRKREVKS
jgi:hypothetical protein